MSNPESPQQQNNSQPGPPQPELQEPELQEPEYEEPEYEDPEYEQPAYPHQGHPHQGYAYHGHPYPGHPYPGYPQPLYLKPPTNVLAVLSLVLSLVFFAPVAVIMGHIAVSQIARTGEDGRGMAIAGLIIGWVQIAFWSLLFFRYALFYSI